MRRARLSRLAARRPRRGPNGERFSSNFSGHTLWSSVHAWWLDKLELPTSDPVKWGGTDKKYKSGTHWLERRYTLSLWHVIYYNYWRARFTGDILVGKDWRENMFFVRMDERHPMKHMRYLVSTEPWEMEHDYDADRLWRSWLNYRLEKPPTPEQCARAFKYREERYSVWNVYLKRKAEMDAMCSPEEHVRMTQEYRDQRWDMRRQKEICTRLMQQKWVWTRHAKANVYMKRHFDSYRNSWEHHTLTELDLLRPPERQRMWKLEEDMRSWRHIEAIENPDYHLNPFEKSWEEMYMLTPSYVAGEPLPQMLQLEKKPQSIVSVFKPFQRRASFGAASGTFAHAGNPFPHFGSALEFDEWFADQRKHLIVARAELEQMKRDGFRPLEIGGDLDPYSMSVEPKSWPEVRAEREQLILEARNERSELERKKGDAAQKLLGFDPQNIYEKKKFNLYQADESEGLMVTGSVQYKAPPSNDIKLFQSIVKTDGRVIEQGSAQGFKYEMMGGGNVDMDAAQDEDAEDDLGVTKGERNPSRGGRVVSVFDKSSIYGVDIEQAARQTAGGPERKRADEVGPDTAALKGRV